MTATAPQSPPSPPCPRWARVIATGFGSGLFPIAPGTCGSLIALIFHGIVFDYFVKLYPANPSALANWQFFLGLRPAPSVISGLLVCTLPVLWTLVGVPAATCYSLASRVKDPQRVVIDEFAGQSLALIPIGFFIQPRMGTHWIAGFLLFRLFDIWKPGPIRRLEKLPGGWGIMADDLAAGAISAVILAMLLHFRLLPGF